MLKKLTLAALLTTACASSKRVVVDKQGIDEAQYQQDLSDCRAVAAEGAAGGSVIGGILGPSSATPAPPDAWPAAAP